MGDKNSKMCGCFDNLNNYIISNLNSVQNSKMLALLMCVVGLIGPTLSLSVDTPKKCRETNKFYDTVFLGCQSCGDNMVPKGKSLCLIFLHNFFSRPFMQVQ